METKIVKSWVDLAPAFLTFLVRFSSIPNGPKSTLLPYARKAGLFPRDLSRTDIASDLTAFLIAGVALSYFILLVADPPGLMEDSGFIATLLRKLDTDTLPAFAVLSIFVVAVLIHSASKLYRLLNRDAALPGTIEDTINAAFGFGSFYIPCFTGTLCLILWLKHIYGSSLVFGLVVLPIALLLYFFPASLSATHRSSWRDAYLAFAGGLTLMFLCFFLIS